MSTIFSALHKRGVGSDGDLENHVRIVLNNENGQITYIEQTSFPSDGGQGRTNIATMDSEKLAEGNDGVPYIGIKFVPDEWNEGN